MRRRPIAVRIAFWGAVTCAAAPSFALAQAGVPPAPKSFGIQGVVKDTAGTPLAATEVTVSNGDVTLTDEKGAFAFSAVPVGATQVEFRRIGYLPAVLAFEGPENVVISLAATMKPVGGVQLGTVIVEGKRIDRGLAATGFYDRERLMKGTFFNPERMARNVGSLTHVLLEAPRMWLSKGVPKMRLRNGGLCDISVFLDGALMTGPTQSPDWYINSGDVKAMEFYADIDAPATVKTHVGTVFIRGKSGGCGVLLLWTK